MHTGENNTAYMSFSLKGMGITLTANPSSLMSFSSVDARSARTSSSCWRSIPSRKAERARFAPLS
jgi:hypothetical protein